MRRLLAAFCLLLLAAPAAALELTAVAIPLNPENPEQRDVGRLRFLGGLELRSADGEFGGLSGLLVEGDRLLAVSDRGSWFAARVVRDGAGRLVDLREPELPPMLGLTGLPLSGTQSDAEGLARAPDGSYVVSFERWHRLWRYPGPDPRRARPRAVLAPKPIFALPDNGGFEAIAALPDGRLLAIAEAARDEAGDLHAWLLSGDGGAARLAWAATGEFKPTDAAALPNGDVLVLERRFTGLVGGIAARIALLPAAALRPGARLEGREIALLERPLSLDNYEGIAVARGAGGKTEVWLVSDDNFNRIFQRTLLLQFELRD